MDIKYKAFRNLVGVAAAIALTAFLLWGIIDAGADELWSSAAAIAGW